MPPPRTSPEIQVATGGRKSFGLKGGRKPAAGVADFRPRVKRQSDRFSGAYNYSTMDVDALLDISEKFLPLDSKGWVVAAQAFGRWAEENRRPRRASRSLELKFKQVSHVMITNITYADTLHC